jgi:hypothetical protein
LIRNDIPSIMASALSSTFRPHHDLRVPGAESRAVRRFCFLPDRSSQTLDAATGTPKLELDKALGAFSRALS